MIVMLLTEQENNSGKPLKFQSCSHGKELNFSFKIFLAAHAYDIFN